MEVTREQVEQACQALRSAFDYSGLEECLYFRLQRDLDKIAPSDLGFSAVCFRLVRQAEKDGWLEELIRAAFHYKSGNTELKALARDLRIETADVNSTDHPATPDSTDSNTSDSLLIIEDFRRDLEEIRADQSWDSEEGADELERLKYRLPGLRRQVRRLVPRSGSDLKQSVLQELQFADAIGNALYSINALELCLNCLLDSSSQDITNQTRYVQSFRSKRMDIEERLGNLRHLGANPRVTREENALSGNVNISLSGFIKDLQESYANNAIQLGERRQLLNSYSGIDASLHAVTEYLNATDIPEECNIRLIRDLLISTRSFIDHTVLAQRHLPVMPGSEPLLPPGEGTRLRRICNEAMDRLDLYYRINHEWMSGWEEAALSGTVRRFTAEDVYQARRCFIEKLANLQRRIAALSY
jgi:hypothetical protein